jgi:hypothetical protein
MENNLSKTRNRRDSKTCIVEAVANSTVSKMSSQPAVIDERLVALFETLQKQELGIFAEKPRVLINIVEENSNMRGLA